MFDNACFFACKELLMIFSIAPDIDARKERRKLSIFYMGMERKDVLKMIYYGFVMYQSPVWVWNIL